MTEEENNNLDLSSDEAQPDASMENPELGTEDTNHTPETDLIQEEEEESSRSASEKIATENPDPDKLKNGRPIPENPNIERDYDDAEIAPYSKALHRIMRETDKILWRREKLILEALEKGIHASYRNDWRNSANLEFRRIVFLNIRRKRYKNGKIA